MNQLKKVNNTDTTGNSNFVKKLKQAINESENKITTDDENYITTEVFNKLTSNNFAARLKQANV